MKKSWLLIDTYTTMLGTMYSCLYGTVVSILYLHRSSFTRQLLTPNHGTATVETQRFSPSERL